MNMEKRWTRKKRAARDAGGAKPKPALSDRRDLAGPEAETVAPPRPRDEAPTPPFVQSAEQPPVQSTERPTERLPERPKEHAAPEAPAPTAVPEVPEVQDALDPALEATPETPQEAVTPQRPVTYRVKRIQRPKPIAPAAAKQVAQEAAQAAPPEPVTPVQAEPAPQQPTPEVAAPEAPIPHPEPAPETPLDPETTDALAQEITPAPATASEPAKDAAEDKAQATSAVALWNRIGKFPVDARGLERNRIVTAAREDPVHYNFDVLRTKLLFALRENGWTRVAVTSPTEGCGKTFMTANLALSLSRQGNCRTVALDFDMRHPSLAPAMSIENPPAIADFLSGKQSAQDFLRRPGRNLHKIGTSVAFGFNGRVEPYAAELLQDDTTANTLNKMEKALAPDVVLLDMPPALVNDDVLAARRLFDGIILVVGGGKTKPHQVRDVERRLGTDTPLLGVVLNKSEDDMSDTYGY